MADKDDLISGIGSPTSGNFSGSPKNDEGYKTGEDEQKENSIVQNGQNKEEAEKNENGDSSITRENDNNTTIGDKKQNGGMFTNHFSKKERQKRKTAKKAQKDLPGPVKKLASFTAARELPGNPVQQSKKRYDATRKSMQKKAAQVQESENPQEIDRLSQEVEQESKQQRKNAFQLMSATMAANIKRLGEYSTGCVPGCLKDLKGCFFSTVKVLCLTILGGASIVGIILKLCGVF